MTLVEQLSQRRPKRADAARNFDALLVAARTAFAELGAGASLEEIARRADVGIATLYRNFPTREALIDSVYAADIDDLCGQTNEAESLEPWKALVAWIDLLVTRLGNKKTLVTALTGPTSPALSARAALWAAGDTVLERAIAAGEVRARVEIDDVMRLVIGVISMHFDDAEQRTRVLGMILDGIRAN